MHDPNVNWQRMSVEDILFHLNTNAACGLTTKAARSRCKRKKENTLFGGRETVSHLWKPLVTDPSLWLLVAVCVLSVFLDAFAAGLCALGGLILSICLLLRFLQTTHSLEEKIEQYRTPWSCVLRDGVRKTVSSKYVVEGDILLLREGDILPCDCRLIRSDTLEVHTLFADESGKPVWLKLPKTADGFGCDANAEAPNCENMLYAGSRILSGEAIAVAVATGENTMLGTLSSFHIPAERNGAKKSDPCAFLRPYFRLYSFAFWILLLLLTFVGAITLASENSLMELFLSLCALMGCASVAVIQLYFYGVANSARKKCLEANSAENRAILKHATAVDSMATLTDVFVLGRCGISEGSPYLFRVTTGKEELEKLEGETYHTLQPLCEAYLLLSDHLCRKREGTHRAPTFDDAALKKEMTRISDFDVKALGVRIKSVTETASEVPEEVCLDVESTTGSYQLIFTEACGRWTSCVSYELDGKLCHTDAKTFARLEDFYRSANEVGARTVTVMKSQNGVKTLIGLFAVRERVQKDLTNTVESLQKLGVRASFFVKDSAENRKSILSAGLWESAITKDQKSGSMALAEVFNKYRVFIGFEQREILSLMNAIQKSGGKVALLGSSIDHLSLAMKSDLMIAADSHTYHQKRADHEELTNTPHAGTDWSNRAAETFRRSADVLVNRASLSGGGLIAILCAILRCRQSREQKRVLVPVLLSTQLFRILIVAFSTVFGVSPLGGVQLIFCGFLLEALFTSWIISLPIPQKASKVKPPLDTGTIERLLTKKSFWLPFVATSAGCVLYAFILKLFGAMTEGDIRSFLLFSVLGISVLAFLKELGKFHLSPKSMKHLRSLMLLVTPFIVGLILRLIFPYASFFEALGDVSLVLLISLPFCPIFYFVSQYLVARFFHQTTK